ncbi:MAG: hypothetical protein HY360_13510 [Verrucomicrobia bacterium]|nr:hypothetical protein [Verrucomicrobiota bacterium]
MSASKEELERMQAALFQGRKIEAIKLYRAGTGAGLADAKTAVEKLEAELRVASPEKFTAQAGRQGCSTAMFVLCVFAMFFIGWMAAR